MMIDPTLVTLFCTGLEKVINTALKYDPGTREKLSSLHEKQLKLACQSPNISLFFNVVENHFSITGYSEKDSDVILEGKLLELIQLLISGDDSLANSNVSVSGKIGVLSDYQAVFNDIDIDWEEPLSDFLGPSLGHSAANMIKAKFSWSAKTVNRAAENLPDILSEEIKVIPSKTELESFYSEVDQIHADAERVAAKVQLLIQSSKKI